ncbi:hypothetical protein RND71_024585 [Anisodus tanguticus]|uniref:Uncharacterized protein n=1 Tax=Anisodus tanguticus TaxID=243964 RepID=A0AAE1VBU0_9SOLA|nr:hypothetical protein RND71_024585 [Anisodus tanguticus]
MASPPEHLIRQIAITQDKECIREALNPPDSPVDDGKMISLRALEKRESSKNLFYSVTEKSNDSSLLGLHQTIPGNSNPGLSSLLPVNRGMCMNDQDEVPSTTSSNLVECPTICVDEDVDDEGQTPRLLRMPMERDDTRKNFECKHDIREQNIQTLMTHDT